MTAFLLRLAGGCGLGGLLALLALLLARTGEGSGLGFALGFPLAVSAVTGVPSFDVVLWGMPLVWGAYLALVPLLPTRRSRGGALGALLALHVVGALPALSLEEVDRAAPVPGVLFAVVFVAAWCVLGRAAR